MIKQFKTFIASNTTGDEHESTYYRYDTVTILTHNFNNNFMIYQKHAFCRYGSSSDGYLLGCTRLLVNFVPLCR